jgi:hypothetical protein
MARVKKYIISEPATLEEVRKTLKITRADQAVVAKVLKRLGYDIPPSPGPKSKPAPKIRETATLTARERPATVAKKVSTRPKSTRG